MELTIHDLKVIECLLFNKNMKGRKIDLKKEHILLDMCKIIDCYDVESKIYNQQTYKSLKKLNTIGILELVGEEERNGKVYDTYKFNIHRLVKWWKKRLDYKISKYVLLLDEDIPQAIKKKIIDEYKKDKILIIKDGW